MLCGLRLKGTVLGSSFLFSRMPRKGRKGDPMALQGLANAWNKNRGIREHLLRANSLLAWPKPKLVGVISFYTVSHNFAVISRVLRNHLPKLQKLKTVNIDAVRKEVVGLTHA